MREVDKLSFALYFKIYTWTPQIYRMHDALLLPAKRKTSQHVHLFTFTLNTSVQNI